MTSFRSVSCITSDTKTIKSTSKINLKLLNIQKKPKDLKKLEISFGTSDHIFYGIGEQFQNLQKLCIKKSIKIITRRNFEMMKNLSELFLDYNPIEYIADNSFNDLKKLTCLSLTHCQIRRVPRLILKSLKNLKEFYFQFNTLSHLDKEFFKNNLKLEIVNFEFNRLTVVEFQLSTCSNLSFLSFRGNKCTDVVFSKNFPQLSNVKSLRHLENLLIDCREKIFF